MKFDAILAYQETDLKLRRLHDEIDKSEANKRADTARQRFNAAKATVEECGKTAEMLVAHVEKETRLYEEASESLQALRAEADAAAEEQLPTIIGQLERLKNKLNELDKRVNDARARAEKALAAFKENNAKGKQAREEFAAAKDRLDALKKAKEPEMAALKQKLADISKSVEPAVMTQYNELKNEGKVFAFVEAVPGEHNSYACRGCGIGLSQTLKSELEDKGWCRCESCRRIVYKVAK